MSTWEKMKAEFQDSLTKEERQAYDAKVKNYGLRLKHWNNDDLKAVSVGVEYEIDDAIGAIIEATNAEEAERAARYYIEFKKDRKAIKREIKKRKKRGHWHE